MKISINYFSNRLLLFWGVLGKDIIQIGQNFFCHPNSWKISLIKCPGKNLKSLIWGFGFPVCAKSSNSQSVTGKIGYQIRLPGLAFLAGRGMIFLKNDPRIYLIETQPEANSTEIQSLRFSETQIIGKNESGLADDNFKRIEYLTHNMLTFIDSRADGQSKLYKDPKDGRFWQMLDHVYEGSNLQEIELTHVTIPQWSFEFLESKNMRARGQNALNQEDFYESLEEDPRKLPCQFEDCKDVRIKGGPYCKRHHYQLIMMP